MAQRRNWTAEDDKLIRELTGAGFCRHAIAVRLGCSDVTLDRRARALDLPLVVKETGRRIRQKRSVVGLESQSL
jgi:hypothetical protein